MSLRNASGSNVSAIKVDDGNPLRAPVRTRQPGIGLAAWHELARAEFAQEGFFRRSSYSAKYWPGICSQMCSECHSPSGMLP
jgi:hypothetical protein